MTLRDVVSRTAWQAGTSEDEADRLVEAFLHELREAILRGESVSLGRFGTFSGPAFTPGPALGAWRPATGDDDAEPAAGEPS